MKDINSMLTLQILQVGFTGFGFLLASMAFFQLNKLGEKIIDAPTRPSDQLVARLLQAFKLNQVLACLFFFLTVIITALPFFITPPSAPPISIGVFPTQEGVDRLVIIKKDSVLLEKRPDGSMGFVADAKTALTVDVNEVAVRMRDSLALNTKLQAQLYRSASSSLISEGGLDAK